MNEFFFSDIPRSVLAALIDFAGKPGSLSPRALMGEASALNKGQLAELYAGNYIDLPEGKTIQFTPAFAQAVRVLLNPHTHAALRIWGEEDVCAETSLLFPETIIEGGGILLNQIDSVYSLS